MSRSADTTLPALSARSAIRPRCFALVIEKRRPSSLISSGPSRPTLMHPQQVGVGAVYTSFIGAGPCLRGASPYDAGMLHEKALLQRQAMNAQGTGATPTG